MWKKTKSKTLISKAAVSDRIFKQELVRLGSGNKVSDVGEGWHDSLVLCVCKIRNHGIFFKSMLYIIIYLSALDKTFLISIYWLTHQNTT